MPSLQPEFLDRLLLSDREASALRSLGAYAGRQERYRRQSSEVLAGLREAALVESSESSNRIEGVTAPRARIEALVRRNAPPRDRSEQEIAGYRDALNLVHSSAPEMGFTANVILQLHGMLYRHEATGRGGRWKTTQNEIVERAPDGTRTVRFRPPSPFVTPRMMSELQDGYATAVDLGREPLIVVPLAILDFLCIHPFADGNGRTSRLLTIQLLYHFEYDVCQYISLERINEESKATYYEALDRSSAAWHESKHDARPWLRYFWGVLIRAYGEFEERVGTIRTGRGAKTDVVEQAIAGRIGAFAISDIEADSPGVSRDWIRLVMRRLRDEGRIVREGKGRGAKWRRTDT
jgi:Fic family protein